MKTALYRKWRPRVFADVVGQEAVRAALKNQVASGRCSHAYIFTGVRGTGKTTFAKILAKAVNCVNAKDGEPCGECYVCKGIDDGSLLDVSEIDAASNNRVDDIRELLDETAFAPAVCRMRVYIVDEVHMLTTNAFNALLKTLEEPPAHVMFILATTEIHKVPATILSRCQRFDLKRIPEEKIAERVSFVAKSEGVDLSENAARLIARLSDGAMRDALSLLDTASSMGETVDENAVARLAGVADKSYLFRLAEKINERDRDSLLRQLRELYESSVDPTRLTLELTRHTRDLLMIKTAGSAALTSCSSEDVERYKKQSVEFTAGRLIDILDALTATAEKLSSSPDRMLSLELCFIKLCEEPRGVEYIAVGKPRAAVPSAPSLRVAVSEGAPPWETPAEDGPTGPPREEKPAERKEIAVPPRANEKGEFERWDEVVRILGAKDPLLNAYLSGSRAFRTESHMLIDASEALFEYIRLNRDTQVMIKAAISEVTGERIPIGPYKKKNVSAAPSALDELIKNAKDNGVEVEVIEG